MSAAAAAAASAALHEHFVRGPVLTDTVSLGPVTSDDHKSREPQQQQQQKQKQQKQQHQQQGKGSKGNKGKGKGNKGKNKNKNKGKRERDADEAWCRAVHTRLKRFLAGGDGAVPFELLGPLAGRAQQRFAVALCRDVYRVPWRVVTLGRDTFVSVTRPRDERPTAPRAEVRLAGRVAQPVRDDSTTSATSSSTTTSSSTAEPHGRALLGRAETEDAVRALAGAAAAAAPGDGEGAAEGMGARAACWGVAEVVAADAAPLWAGAGDNVGLQLLERMGWTRGTGLGRAEQGAVEPLCAVTKPDRCGVGAEPPSRPQHPQQHQHQQHQQRGRGGRAREHGRPRGAEREWQRERRRERDEKGARW